MLEVVNPASSYDLATLAEVKGYLGVVGLDSDADLQIQITAASEAIAGYCRRTLVAEGVRETFWDGGRQTGQLTLRGWPVNSVSLVVEDGITLAPGDYQLDSRAGMLLRLDTNGAPRRWGERVSVTYSAGYAAIPTALRMAAILTVKAMRESKARDGQVRSERFEGYGEVSYYSVTKDALPLEASGLLAYYVDSPL